jgi:hypothetical protein
MYVKVSGTNFIRDINSMAIINVDNTQRDEYYAKQKILQNQKVELNTIRSEIDDIKCDVSDIKQLLLQLIEKGTHG